jgi:hypothetical protein
MNRLIIAVLLALMVISNGVDATQRIERRIRRVRSVAPDDTAAETPVGEAPVEETPVGEAPVEETPVGEAPVVEETPVGETPVEETPVGEAPVEETPVGEAPVVEETPVGEAPVEETPVGEAAVEETPVGEAPVVEETPVGEAPVEEIPQEEVSPVDGDTKPVDEIPEESVTAPEASEPAEAATQASKITGDITMREGLGDNLPYPGSDYLGVGYNIFEGNPEGDPLTQMDPGFRQPVIDLTWSQDRTSRDVRDLQPVGGYAMPEVSCYQNDDVVTSSSEEDYNEELAESVDMEASAEGGFGGVEAGASFSASRGSQSFTNNVATTTNTRYTITSYCVEFKVAFQPFTDFSKQSPVPEIQPKAIKLQAVSKMDDKDSGESEKAAAASFKSARASPEEGEPGEKPMEDTSSEKGACDVDAHDMIPMCKNERLQLAEKCPKMCALAAWYEFFEVFGTHFLSTVHLGGKRISEIIIDESTKEAIESNGMDASMAVAAHAKVEAGGATGGAHASFGMSEAESAGTSAMDSSSNTKSKTLVFGGIPPSDNGADGFGEWAETVRDFPMPVRYSLISNYVILKYIEGVQFDDQDYNYAMNEYVAYAKVIAKHVAKKEKELEEAKVAREEAEEAAASAEEAASITIITESMGEITEIAPRGGACLESSNVKAASDAVIVKQGHRWYSPNKKVAAVFLPSGFLGVYAADGGKLKKLLWHSDKDAQLKTESEKYYSMREKEFVYDVTNGYNSYVSGCSYTSTMNKLYGCGSGSEQTYRLSISGDMELSIDMYHDEGYHDGYLYRRNMWKSCQGSKSKRFKRMVLKDDGLLVIEGHEGAIIWSSDSSVDGKPMKAPKKSMGKGKCM